MRLEPDLSASPLKCETCTAAQCPVTKKQEVQSNDSREKPQLPCVIPAVPRCSDPRRYGSQSSLPRRSEGCRWVRDRAAAPSPVVLQQPWHRPRSSSALRCLSPGAPGQPQAPATLRLRSFVLSLPSLCFPGPVLLCCRVPTAHLTASAPPGSSPQLQRAI